MSTMCSLQLKTAESFVRFARVVLRPDETPKNGVKPHDVNSYSRFGGRAFGDFFRMVGGAFGDFFTMDFSMVGLGEPLLMFGPVAHSSFCLSGAVLAIKLNICLG
jgi:hypothetical protein